jgi:hypothetical protein
MLHTISLVLALDFILGCEIYHCGFPPLLSYSQGNADAAAAHLLSLLAEGGTDDTPVDAAPQPASSSSERNEDLVDNSDGVREDGYQAEQGEGSRPEQKTSAAVDATRLAEASLS